MRVFVKALLAAALITPLLADAANAAAAGGLLGGLGAAGRAGGGGGGPPPSVGPQGGGGIGPQGAGPGIGRGGGGFGRGDGFRGGGGYRGRDRFYGSVFIGPGYGPGWYDPFWWPYGPYGYGYGYGYAPPRVVERVYAPPPADYLGVPDGPPPQQNWYHCRSPEGYYPYVRECNGEWEAVPVAPPDGPPPPRQGG